MNTLGRKIIIAGGGLAGLIAAIRLARKGFDCTVIEKKTYPFHRVCGEYISHETTGFLKQEGLYPDVFHPAQITQLQLSTVKGKNIHLPLDLGGFGISRYAYDNFLYEIAKKAGVNFLLQKEVEAIVYSDSGFIVSINQQRLHADIVIGAFGKRSKLDVQQSRAFIRKRSPYVGIKYHARFDHPKNLIGLHNFRGGYCGVSNVEENKTNICYLTHRENVKHFGSIEELEKNVLFENPHLKNIFTHAEFLFANPEVINEISFETKGPVHDHILMLGDAAGMITPLCGNGMAMAIHSAKILSDLIIQSGEKDFQLSTLEKAYSGQWNKTFSRRLWIGRQIQNKLFGTTSGSACAINLAIHSPFLAKQLIKFTHGTEIQ